MKQVTFEELRQKEIINLKDGKRLGYISDLHIDLECGNILSFTVQDCSVFFPSKKNVLLVPWEQVSKIGDDFIFIDICYPQQPTCCKKKFLG